MADHTVDVVDTTKDLLHVVHVEVMADLVTEVRGTFIVCAVYTGHCLLSKFVCNMNAINGDCECQPL